jgi:hypothetical protein
MVFKIDLSIGLQETLAQKLQVQKDLQRYCIKVINSIKNVIVFAI